MRNSHSHGWYDGLETCKRTGRKATCIQLTAWSVVLIFPPSLLYCLTRVLLVKIDTSRIVLVLKDFLILSFRHIRGHEEQLLPLPKKEILKYYIWATNPHRLEQKEFSGSGTIGPFTKVSMHELSQPYSSYANICSSLIVKMINFYRNEY